MEIARSSHVGFLWPLSHQSKTSLRGLDRVVDRSLGPWWPDFEDLTTPAGVMLSSLGPRLQRI